MFNHQTLGYHDNDMCGFDLWAPRREDCMVHPKQDTCYLEADPSHFSDLYDKIPHCAVENRAFSPFAKHEQEKEDIVNLILSGATQIQFDDEMSQEDLRWIEQEVYRRSGATCSLT